jgi:hypothetical protein
MTKTKQQPATPDDNLDVRLNALAQRLAELEAKLRHHFANSGTAPPDTPPDRPPPPAAGATP